MKVLMVNKFLYPRGGAETYLLKLGEQLEEMGHEVVYFGMQDGRNIVGNRAGLYTQNMDFHSKSIKRLRYAFKVIYSREAKQKLKRLILLEKPDIVHLQNIAFQLTPSVIDAASEMGVPVVQTVHDAQALCPSHMLLDLKAMRPCTLCANGDKWNCVKHACIHGSRLKSLLGTLEAEVHIRRGTYGKVAKYICPSHFMEVLLSRDARFCGKTLVLPNFVERAARIKPRECANTAQKYVLYFGRLAPEKGIERLLTVCRSLPQIPFVIAGGGPLAGECAACGLPNVRYVGFQTGEKLRQLICGAAFTVYLSLWLENCPLSVLESQALGVPVVASRLGGIPELIRDGETGVLVDATDARACAETIEALYSDAQRLETLSAGCVKWSQEALLLEEYAERMLQIYRQVIESKALLCGCGV